MKISPLRKRWRQLGAMPGQPSCIWCCEGDHEHCEKRMFIFCNCWRSKHTLSGSDLHRKFLPEIAHPYLENKVWGSIGVGTKTKKKGSR